MSKCLIEKSSKGEDGLFNLIYLPQCEKELKPHTEAEALSMNAMCHLAEGKVEEGREELEKAYLIGDVWSGNTLAYGLTAGWFGENDDGKAIEIWRKLARRGYDKAMNSLGWLYCDGRGLNRSLRWARYWFRKAMECGNVFAVSNLANSYIFAPKGQRDYNLAFELAQKSANLSDPEGYNLLGLCYRYGYGVEKDLTEAFEWYQKAYNSGAGPCSAYNLAQCYRKGRGVPQDLSKARDLYLEAQAGGFPIDVNPDNL